MKKRNFSELSERELLALAITLEEEDNRTYSDIAAALQPQFPDTAKVFSGMAEEENTHRHQLLDLYQSKFGDHIPYIRREDVKGFVERDSVWLSPNLSVERARERAALMEAETARFYRRSSQLSRDAAIRQLLGDLAAEEAKHEHRANSLEEQLVTEDVEHKERLAQRKLWLLQIVQPGLVGLMDGSVSTLAPLFAAAFASHNSWQTFLVGVAASVGAAISMGFTEAASDNGSLTGRGSPLWRGLICGLMTFAGGMGHTLPYLIENVAVANGLAITVVICELLTIAWIRKRFMDTPFITATLQVVVGGLLVLAAGILIGSS